MRNELAKTDRTDRLELPDLNASDDRALSQASLDSYKSDVDHFNGWLAECGREVCVEAIADYFDALEDAGASGATLNRRRYSILRALDGLFEEPQRSVIISAVKSATPTYKTDDAVEDVLTKDQVERLADGASDRLALIIETLWRTAARVSELTGMKHTDVTVNGHATIRIHGKGRKERNIKVPKAFYERINEVFGGEKYLFETRGGNPYNRSNLYRQLQRLADRLDFDGPVNPHIFRHSRATYMLTELGMSLKAVSRFLGHSSTSIIADLYICDTVDYNHLFEADNGFAYD